MSLKPKPDKKKEGPKMSYQDPDLAFPKPQKKAKKGKK